jgi:hypothetical protein
MMKHILALVILLSSASAFSDIRQLSTVPSLWKMENYFGDSLVVFFSGSMCEHGRLSFPSLATVADKNRFWSVLLAARTSKTTMFVRYDDTTNKCNIVSFGVAG